MNAGLVYTVRTLYVLVSFAALTACGGNGSSTGSTAAAPSERVNASSVTAAIVVSYPSPQAYVVGTAITPLDPTVTGAGISRLCLRPYSVSPALPAGLTLDVVTGRISGTPTTVTAAANYTVTAQTTDGSSAFVLSLAVNTSGPQLPAAPIVSVSYGLKQVVLNWTAVPGASFYRVMRSTTTGSGTTQIGGDLTATTYSDTVAVHRTDWVTSFYVVQACNGSVCLDSAPTSALDSTQAIGYFKASNPGIGDSFGESVAISADGNTLAVGTTNEASNATGIGGNQADNSTQAAGAVYLYARVNGTWVQQAYVKASNTGANDRFGRELALSADGNTLAVSAIFEASNATGINGNQADNSFIGAGAAYVFTRSGSSWSQQAYVKASNTATSDAFGWSLALSADGNTLAVGAILEDSNAAGIDGNQADNSLSGAGAAYVYTRSGSTWSQQAYVKASNPGASDNFGTALALSANGDTLAVGATRESSSATGINGNQADNSVSGAGAVYVYTRSGSTWSQQAYVKASNTGANDSFGSGMALSADGNTMAVAAVDEFSNATGIDGNQADNSSFGAGAVYVYTRLGTTWSQQAYVKASNTATDDHFGWAPALSADGNTLAVSAVLEDSNATGINGDQSVNSFDAAGAVYVYTRSDTTWSQQSYVKASNTYFGDNFGSALALTADGNTLAVGATGESSGATGIGGDQTDNSVIGAGAVYVY